MIPARNLLHVSDRQCSATLQQLLFQGNWRLTHARDLKTACRLLREQRFLAALVVLDDLDPDTLGDFDACAAAAPRCEWVAVLPRMDSGSPALRELVLNRLFDYHTEPADPRFLCQSLGHAHGRATLACEGTLAGCGGEDGLGMVGRSPAIVGLRHMIRKAGPADAPVLIGGESGCGKELVAQAMHRCSPRASGPFVAVNCGALAPTLIHSELFGHERGSFSGASTTHRGLIESARGGTLFLDEIAELPLDLQATLLRFLQEKTIQRLGAVQSMVADTRVMAASHTDLPAAVAAGTFREDVYYRLSVLAIAVPPLRDRATDIPLLAQHFLERSARVRPRPPRGFSSGAMAALTAHSWPGNVRELFNRVQRAVVMADQRLISASDLGLAAEAPVDWGGLQEIRVKAEKSAICGSLDRVSHNVTLAARELGVSRMTLYRLMAKHSITPGTV
jgi:two-component system response regulator HydG